MLTALSILKVEFLLDVAHLFHVQHFLLEQQQHPFIPLWTTLAKVRAQ